MTTLSLLFLIVSGVAMLHGLTYNPDVPLINQESMLVFGTHGLGYAVTVIISFATMSILGVAANTAFTGCPALWSSMAKDGYMPRWVLHKGDRLVYSNGIVFLDIDIARTDHRVRREGKRVNAPVRRISVLHI